MSELNRRQVNEVFLGALELRPGDRAPYLDIECAGDAALRAEVESLLAASEESGGFLEQPAPLSVFAELGPEMPVVAEGLTGTCIGPYRLVSPMGEGGMGTVYRAERADGASGRPVAIKLLHRDLDRGTMLRRFQTERQILASLDHPNIARLLDGGVTAEGRPYFVMELIEGRSLSAYAEEEKLSLRARLELFRLICGAVQSAHQKLVVHRDLKPANILVTAEGVPKLLDFGIAKLLDSETASERTATGMQLMTPAYASPEQVRGELISTSSDIYSLGVLLFELLTGAKPLKLPTGDPLAAARMVSEQEPPRPSSLNPALAGDLDNILLKALAKEPGRRYGSAVELADDLRRHLQGLPVEARAATWRYRTGKFVRRHRWAVAATVLLVVTVVAGVAATLRETRRAQARFNDVRALSNSVLFEIHDAIQGLPGSTQARELVVSRALQFLDKLAADSGTDLDLQEEIAAGYTRLGDVQGFSGRSNLGKQAAAQVSYLKALGLREAIAAARPNDLEAQRNLGNALDLLGNSLQEQGEQKRSKDYFDRAHAIRERLGSLYPDDLARSYFSRAQSEVTAGAFEAGLMNHRKALALWEEVAPTKPGALRRSRSIAHKRIGGILVRLNRLDEAQGEYEASLRLDQLRLEEKPSDVEVKLDMSFAYSDLALIWMRREALAKALQLAQQCETLRAEVYAADPQNERARGALASAYARVANIQWRKGDRAASLASYEKALPMRRAAVAANPGRVSERAALADVLGELGEGYRLVGQRERARAILKEAVAETEVVLAAWPKREDVRKQMAQYRSGLAKVE